MNKTILTGLIFLIFALHCATVQALLNGENWRALAPEGMPTGEAKTIASVARITLIKGIYDGILCTNPSAYEELFYVDVEPRHLVTALDQFYDDYRNIKIPVVFALQVIAMELKGEDKQRIDDYLRKLRQASKDIPTDPAIKEFRKELNKLRSLRRN